MNEALLYQERKTVITSTFLKPGACGGASRVLIVKMRGILAAPEHPFSLRLQNNANYRLSLTLMQTATIILDLLCRLVSFTCIVVCTRALPRDGMAQISLSRSISLHSSRPQRTRRHPRSHPPVQTTQCKPERSRHDSASPQIVLDRHQADQYHPATRTYAPGCSPRIGC